MPKYLVPSSRKYRTTCASMKIDYRIVRTDEPLDLFVRAYLEERRKDSPEVTRLMLSLFLVPMFMVIGGLAAVSIPLVLHLIQSSRTVRMPYSTIRFLQLAQKKSSQKIRMENILLWLIRTLLLLAIAAGFAMPMLRKSRDSATWAPANAARDIAIVIDGSYSMDYQPRTHHGLAKIYGHRLWAFSKTWNEQDRFCIFIARENPDPLIEQLSERPRRGDQPPEVAQNSPKPAPCLAPTRSWRPTKCCANPKNGAKLRDPYPHRHPGTALGRHGSRIYGRSR